MSPVHADAGFDSNPPGLLCAEVHRFKVWIDSSSVAAEAPRCSRWLTRQRFPGRSRNMCMNWWDGVNVRELQV